MTLRPLSSAIAVWVVWLVCVAQVKAAPGAHSLFNDTPLPLRSEQAPQPSADPQGYPGLAAPPAPAYRQTAADPDKPLHVGDQVTLEIVEDKTGPVQKVVTATGDLDVQPLGRVHVSGKSCSAVEAELKRKLEADYYYKATVHLAIDMVMQEPIVYGKVYVAGAVKAPGPIPLDPGERVTVSNIILKAGGFAQFAASDDVRITQKERGGAKQTVKVDVLGVWKAKAHVEDPVVHDGDYIWVPQKAINW